MIMPNYNGDKYLEKSINSFLWQNYQNKELVIIDGKSTDKSPKIIARYVRKYQNIKWVKIKDKGISDAINIGVKKSQGDLIGYLGSDDFLYKDIFDEIAYNYRLINFDAIYFDSITHFVKKNRIIFRSCPNLKITRINLIRFGTIVGLQNIYFKRHVFDKYLFDKSMKLAMDFDFLLKISNRGYLFHYVNTIASINVQDGNISTNRSSAQRKETIQAMKRYAKSPIEKLLLMIKKVQFQLWQN